MVFLRSPASQDLINFVGTKKRISANDALQHFGFKTTKAGLTNLEKKLKENDIKIEGRRGKHAVYFSDPNGYTQITLSLPLPPPGQPLGGHLSVEFEGQVADADAYITY